jgi:hypothetical protein
VRPCGATGAGGAGAAGGAAVVSSEAGGIGDDQAAGRSGVGATGAGGAAVGGTETGGAAGGGAGGGSETAGAAGGGAGGGSETGGAAGGGAGAGSETGGAAPGAAPPVAPAPARSDVRMRRVYTPVCSAGPAGGAAGRGAASATGAPGPVAAGAALPALDPRARASALATQSSRLANPSISRVTTTAEPATSRRARTWLASASASAAGSKSAPPGRRSLSPTKWTSTASPSASSARYVVTPCWVSRSESL